MDASFSGLRDSVVEMTINLEHFEQYWTNSKKVAPLPLHPDNFTPLQRTPWGAFSLCQDLKEKICPEHVGKRVGEAWEFSCEPDFPSQLLGSTILLKDLIAKYPKPLLSKEYIEKKGRAECDLLVKVLSSSEDLSLQLHPTHDDPSLKADECGKYESWYILKAEKGAGVFLGFEEGVDKEDVISALRQQKDVRSFLKFHPVKEGDYFDIPPGTCHAVGKGLMILEAQHVLWGKKGKTYRVYDWGRLYNKEGHLDPQGKARELHVEEALPWIDPKGQSGESFFAQIRSKAEDVLSEKGVLVKSYRRHSYYKIHKVMLSSSQKITLNVASGFAALLPIEGMFSAQAEGAHKTYWQKGQPGFLPFSVFPLSFEALEDTIFFVIVSEFGEETWSV